MTNTTPLLRCAYCGTSRLYDIENIAAGASACRRKVSMTNRHTESAFETLIEDCLLQNGYTRIAREGFDRFMNDLPFQEVVTS